MGEAGAFLIIWHPPVGNAVLGVPRSRTAVFGQRQANPQPLPCRVGAAPHGRRADKRRRWANSQTCCGIAQRRSMSWVLLRGKGKPFPYRGTDADSPGVCPGRGCCCAACRVGTPYNRAGADSPGIGPCLWRVLRGMSRTPSPTGGDGCGFAGGLSMSWVLLRGVPGRHALRLGTCGFAGGVRVDCLSEIGQFTHFRRHSGRSALCPPCFLGYAVCCTGRNSRRRRS